MQRKSWMMLLAQCTPNPKAIAQKPQMQTHSAEGGLQRQGKARCCCMSCMCIANCTASTVCMMQWVMCKLHRKQYIQCSVCSIQSAAKLHREVCSVVNVEWRQCRTQSTKASPPCFWIFSSLLWISTKGSNQSPSSLTNS